MRKWERYLVVGIAELLIAFVLIIWAIQSLDESDLFFLWPLLFGCVLLGSGSTDLAVVYEFYMLEKERGA